MTMTGLNPGTGRARSGIDHLRASIQDILTTPVGSRVMRREYGSRLFELVDNNLNALTLAQIYAATADALSKWEPRLKVTRVSATSAAADLALGKVSLTLEGEYLPDGESIKMEGIVL